MRADVTKTIRSSLARGVALFGVAGFATGLVLSASSPVEARKQRAAAPPPPPPIAKPVEPLVLVVSIKRQRVSIYAGLKKIAEAPISSGQRGYETPQGTFTILEKHKTHFSNLYAGAPMPFMQRVTWSGVALHAGALPGYPASHGCIRLPFSFARQLFDLTSMGARVVIVADEATPLEIAHARLLTGLPSEADLAPLVSQAGQTEVSVANTGEMIPEFATDTGGTLIEGRTEVATTSSMTPPAMTPEPVSPARRTKEQAAAAREAEIQRLAIAETAALTRQIEVARHAKEAVTAVATAKEAARLAKAEAMRLARAAESAEKAIRAAQAQLESFAKTTLPVGETERAQAAALETDLENRLEDLVMSSRDVRRQAAEAVEESRVRDAAIKDAEIERVRAAAEIKTMVGTVKAAKEAHELAKRVRYYRDFPVSVFVSRKANKVYIRQANQILAEGPVIIAKPEKPIGTHVYTAWAPKEGDPTTFRWNVVSLEAAPGSSYILRADRQAKKFAETLPSSQQLINSSQHGLEMANAALDRVTIPSETQDLVAEFVKPGASLIISDHDVSRETGKGTDFIVLTGPAPQANPTPPRTTRTRVRESDPYFAPPRKSRKPRRYTAPPSLFSVF